MNGSIVLLEPGALPTLLPPQPAPPESAFDAACLPVADREREPTLPGVELSVVVPTFNERDNVIEVVRRLDRALTGISWEIIFVDDDSPDGTAAFVRELAVRDRRIRCLQRIGRRGLSSACIEGMLASAAPYFAVMDGDLQHDERRLPEMLSMLERDRLDIVVGSRHAPGGGLGDWQADRVRISRLAANASRSILQQKLSDPMSGFFVLRREAFLDRVRSLSGIGFKILLDLFATGPTPLRFGEVPYEFASRTSGGSKLDNRAAWDFLLLLLDKALGGWLPIRFVTFALVGAAGLLVHLTVMDGAFTVARLPFPMAQAIATLVAMTSNFALNNELTYRDQRLRGWRWWRGWLTFSAACGIGALSNVGIASYLFTSSKGWVLSAVAGTIVGAVWNYALTATFTWKAAVRP